MQSKKTKLEIFREGISLFIETPLPEDLFLEYCQDDERYGKGEQALRVWINFNLKDNVRDWITANSVLNAVELLYNNAVEANMLAPDLEVIPANGSENIIELTDENMPIETLEKLGITQNKLNTDVITVKDIGLFYLDGEFNFKNSLKAIFKGGFNIGYAKAEKNTKDTSNENEADKSFYDNYGNP